MRPSKGTEFTINSVNYIVTAKWNSGAIDYMRKKDGFEWHSMCEKFTQKFNEGELTIVKLV